MLFPELILQKADNGKTETPRLSVTGAGGVGDLALFGQTVAGATGRRRAVLQLEADFRRPGRRSRGQWRRCSAGPRDAETGWEARDPQAPRSQTLGGFPGQNPQFPWEKQGCVCAGTKDGGLSFPLVFLFKEQ